VIEVITILGFIAAVHVIIILKVILAVWRAAGEQARPVYERYDPARHEFPRDVSAWLEANANALSREGFAVAGDLLRLGPPTTQRVLLILNDVTEERGMVAAVLGSKGGGGMFVEFTAERPDGRALEVSNTGRLPERRHVSADEPPGGNGLFPTRPGNAHLQAHAQRRSSDDPVGLCNRPHGGLDRRATARRCRAAPASVVTSSAWQVSWPGARR